MSSQSLIPNPSIIQHSISNSIDACLEFSSSFFFTVSFYESKKFRVINDVLFKKRYLKPSDFRIEYPLLKKLMSKGLYVEKGIHSILFKKLFEVFIFVLHVF